MVNNTGIYLSRRKGIITILMVTIKEINGGRSRCGTHPVRLNVFGKEKSNNYESLNRRRGSHPR
jgi:hypothetical protein